MASTSWICWLHHHRRRRITEDHQGIRVLVDMVHLSPGGTSKTPYR